MKLLAFLLFAGVTLPAAHSICHKEWIAFGDSCYKKFPHVGLMYEAAVEFCGEVRAQMLTIDSEAEDHFISSRFVHIEGNVWVNAADSKYHNFIEGVTASPLETCAAMRFQTRDSSKWIRLECSRPEEIVCKAPALNLDGYFVDVIEELELDVCGKVTTPPPTLSPTLSPTLLPTHQPTVLPSQQLHFSTRNLNECPSGWLRFENKCFFVSKIEMNFTDAFEFCKAKDAWLLSIHSEEENDFVARNKVDDAWLGLLTNQDLEGAFFWIDGGDWNYNHWHPKYPDNKLGWCSTVSSSNWYSHHCGDTNYMAICTKYLVN